VPNRAAQFSDLQTPSLWHSLF